jgi:protein-tyrosine kinase
MSRVYEALNKATREKMRDGQKEADSLPGSAPSTPAEAEFASVAAYVGQESLPVFNGKSGRDATRTNEHLRVKSWRETLEEIFFGWDIRRYSNYPIVSLQEDSPAAEQYKMLREQLKVMRNEAGIRSVVITSPVKREGKTTIAVNLAAAMALEYEEKVLLIDADLRAPSIHHYFNLNVSHGLSEYLGSNSNAGLKTLVSQTHLEGLQVLVAGKPTRFASELLAKDKMRQLMEEIHSELSGYTVIIDSPPVLSTPDPLVLSRHIDGIIVVVRANKTPKEYLTKAMGAFNSSKIVGVVVNGADFGLAPKYYYQDEHR